MEGSEGEAWKLLLCLQIFEFMGSPRTICEGSVENLFDPFRDVRLAPKALPVAGIILYKNIHIHVSEYKCKHTCIYVYMYISIYTSKRVCVYILIHIRTYIHACIHTYIHACIHTDIHTYARTYIHMYMHMLQESWADSRGFWARTSTPPRTSWEVPRSWFPTASPTRLLAMSLWNAESGAGLNICFY